MSSARSERMVRTVRTQYKTVKVRTRYIIYEMYYIYIQIPLPLLINIEDYPVGF